MIIAHNVWRFLENPNALWVEILAQKYLDKKEFKDYRVKQKDSRFWKAMIKHRDFILNNNKMDYWGWIIR